MSTAELIPAELGREIPHRVTRCAECRMRIKAADDDLEPLCWGCAARDEIVAEIEAKNPRRALPPVVEHQVPVEYASEAGRPFGLGFGELPASKLTQSIRESENDERESLMGAYVTGGFLLVLVGLGFLAVAAVG